MEGTDTLSDAEMRLITINGQTMMLDGNFENVNMTNEFLNEMLIVNSPKNVISEGNSGELNENSCINCLKETNDESTKLELTIQGENNELQTIQIGLEEAKALGLYFYGFGMDDGIENWGNCTLNGIDDQAVKTDEKVNNESLEMDTTKLKLQSVPVVSDSCLDRFEENLHAIDEVNKFNDPLNTSDIFPYSINSKDDKLKVQEENPESLPEIGHLEGFQIPTSEDGVLLPATVNAKMVDGSYQTITLVPQVMNGTVTYTVHFSNLDREAVNRNLSNLNIKETNNHFLGPISNGIDSVTNEIIENEINSVDDFLNSVQTVRNNRLKNILPNSLQKFSDNKINSALINTSGEESILKVNRTNFTGSELPVNYLVQDHVPIETKIDNLISENENVISKCKKVRYGKKMKNSDLETSPQKVNKSNIAKTKKVKFKNKGTEEVEQKKPKMSLLKPNNDFRLDSNKKLEPSKPVNTNVMPHMNLNGRLEYPNLKAIDETAPTLPFFKVKSSSATKQPYFNVLPYPKDKTIPVQKQILPSLNCDLQQAKNLMNLQKFLENQKLQLKLQPLASKGSKILSIKPKPTLNENDKVLKEDSSANSNQLNNNLRNTDCSNDLVRNGSNHISQEEETAKKSYQDNLNVKDGKSNCLKFLKQKSSESSKETEKEPESSNKSNGIFIKNNPEYFSQKFKDGKADEHPLGSSENPIQLVQTGHTFHSRQPLSESQLRQIASILQKQKFDSPNVKKNSIFDPKTNTRIVYRVVYPEDVELKDSDRSNEAIKRKRGRHKTKSNNVEDEYQKKSSLLSKGPGRPKKNPTALEEEIIEEEIEETGQKKKIPRTRSGRLSRPPRYMVKDYKRLKNSFEASEKTSNYDSDETFSIFQNGKKVAIKSNKIADLEIDPNLLPGLRPQQRSKRNFKPEYRCPTCQKIYLGHTRMMWHLNKFPDHCNVEKYKENYYRKRADTKARRAARRLNLCDVTNKFKQVLHSMTKDELASFCGPILAEALTTWDFMLLRVNFLKASRKDEVDALLYELVSLLEKLTKLAEDIFLPVFTNEAEKDEDCIEIDRMEVAIALGLPVGYYKINNNNLNLLKAPLKPFPGITVPEKEMDIHQTKIDPECLFSEDQIDDNNRKLFEGKPDPWDEDKDDKKLEEESFWLENKVESVDGWHQPEDSPVKTLSTKFEPNLSTKILDSSNDSIDDGKYEEPVQLMDLDSNSKDIEQSNSSGNSSSPDLGLVKDLRKLENKSQERESEEKRTELWSENSTVKVWNENANIVPAKTPSELWSNENSEMAPSSSEKPTNLWNENSNLSKKVDDTNSEFLDSLLSVPNSNGFLANGTGGFLSENITLMNDKPEGLKVSNSMSETKKKTEWRSDRDNYMRVWETEKNPSWSKNGPILSTGLHERMPGVRTANRLTSTPETNENMSFTMSNRRNSISDFSNINLESPNLDVVLPPAKTLIKDCLKDNLKPDESFLGGSDNLQVKSWASDNSKPDFSTGNDNSEELMKIALESLTSQHDVINVPASSFDSAMGILNQSQESSNLMFPSSETDGLDFNLPLPDHLLRTNFSSENFQTTCASTFPTSESPPTFLSSGASLFGNSNLSNSMDQFESLTKKSKSIDDVMDFFESKNSFNRFEGCGGEENINNFSFGSQSTQFDTSLTNVRNSGRTEKKKVKVRCKKITGRNPRKVVKKSKTKKPVDYDKPKTIESIINEALFESCSSNTKSLQIKDSSPSGNSSIPNGTENYSLPIIPESLDEVENLDFLNQD